MSAPLKISQLRELAGRFPQGIAVPGMIMLIAMLALGPVVPSPAFWHIMAVPSASPVKSVKVSPWAGGLEEPVATDDLDGGTAPLTSASYTSGFDKAAAGLAPEKPATAVAKAAPARDPHGCPNDLNCSFRTAKVTALPPRRPGAASASEPAAQTSANPAPVVVAEADTPKPQPTGLAALTSRLPSPHTLLTPFTFVADTFTGLVKKL